MKKRLLYLIFPMIALLLEILPYGAVCNFANPEGEPWRHTYSYFDLTPFGYANFAPLLTAAATCVLLLILVIHVMSGKGSLLPGLRIGFFVCAVLSLGPLAFGIQFFSVTGGLITISLLVEAILLHFAIKDRQ